MFPTGVPVLVSLLKETVENQKIPNSEVTEFCELHSSISVRWLCVCPFRFSLFLCFRLFYAPLLLQDIQWHIFAILKLILKNEKPSGVWGGSSLSMHNNFFSLSLLLLLLSKFLILILARVSIDIYSDIATVLHKLHPLAAGPAVEVMGLLQGAGEELSYQSVQMMMNV